LIAAVTAVDFVAAAVVVVVVDEIVVFDSL
jgi:hypothetical protein